MSKAMIKILILFVIGLFSSIYAIQNQAMVSKISSTSSLDNLLNERGYTQIPLIKIRGALYAQARISKHPVYLLLDTGSVDASVLSDGIKQLNLNYIQSNQKTANMSGGVSLAQQVLLPTLDIGPIHLSDIRAAVMQQPFKNNLPTVVIGNELLNKFHAILDLDQNVLYLSKNELSKKDQFQLDQALKNEGYQDIQLTKLFSGHFIMPAQVNSALPVNLLFDTGTSDTTLSTPYVNYLNIMPETAYQAQNATNGNITTADIKLQKIILNPLQIFFQKPIELQNVAATSADISSLANFLGVVGVLGLRNMQQLHAVINIPSGTVFLKFN